MIVYASVVQRCRTIVFDVWCCVLVDCQQTRAQARPRAVSGHRLAFAARRMARLRNRHRSGKHEQIVRSLSFFLCCLSSVASHCVSAACLCSVTDLPVFLQAFLIIGLFLNFAVYPRYAHLPFCNHYSITDVRFLSVFSDFLLFHREPTVEHAAGGEIEYAQLRRERRIS